MLLIASIEKPLLSESYSRVESRNSFHYSITNKPVPLPRVTAYKLNICILALTSKFLEGRTVHKTRLHAHKIMDICANLMTVCHVAYLRSSALLAQNCPTIVKQL